MMPARMRAITTTVASAIAMTILGCAQSPHLDSGQESALSETRMRQSQIPEEVATLGLRLTRGHDDWLLDIELRNCGRDSLRVDGELIYLLLVEAIDSNDDYVNDQIAMPNLCPKSVPQIDKRLIELKPGERISRTVSLTKGFRSYGCSRATYANGNVLYHGDSVGAESCRRFDFGGLSPTSLQFKVTYGSHVGLGCPAYDTDATPEQLGVYRGPLVAHIRGDANTKRSDWD